MINVSDKGKRFEREIRNTLKKLDPAIQRSYGSGNLKKYSAKHEADLVTDLPFSIECKFDNQISLYKAWEQAVNQNTHIDKIPLLAMKKNNKPTLWIMAWEDGVQMAQFALESGYSVHKLMINKPQKKVKQTIEETKDLPFSKYKQIERSRKKVV